MDCIFCSSAIDSELQAMASGSEGESSNKKDAVEFTEDIQYRRELYKAADSGDLNTVKIFLKDKPEALTSALTTEGDTALDIAVIAGRLKLVKELVNYALDKKDWAMMDSHGSTPFYHAAMVGVRETADQYFVTTIREWLVLPNKYGDIPVVVASCNGHNDMVRYLYSKTPKEVLGPDEGKNGKNGPKEVLGPDNGKNGPKEVLGPDDKGKNGKNGPKEVLGPDDKGKKGTNGELLFETCISGDIYDIPLDLLQHHPKLASLDPLAQKPSAFPSGTPLAFWQKWIYSRIHVRDGPAEYKNFITGGINIRGGQAEYKNFITRALNQLFDGVWKSLKLHVPAIRHIYELQLTHMQSQRLLSCICREISKQGEAEIERAKKAVLKAIEHGIVEIVTEIIKHCPAILLHCDAQGHGIFAYAIMQRQEKIFSLIYTIRPNKSKMLAYQLDRLHNRSQCGNTLLHQAALLAPPYQLDRLSSAALQMQRELQWFKEVESIVQSNYKELKNNNGKTPQALFNDEHKTLMEKGEKWMKDTAQSCTVVAALIATIMFAAAFTVPGGYDDSTGIPHYIHRNSFVVFIISDALSFFSSCTSVLMSLGILTSKYREKDFLISLPRILLLGLSSLFFSIETMMVTFGVNIVIVLKERITWVSFPIILMATLPVTFFALVQVPLFVEIFLSTYGPGIFNKPKKLPVEG